MMVKKLRNGVINLKWYECLKTDLLKETEKENSSL